ncbi:hypothetical protein SELMODRAFT_405569 [Selaginella moellendorffii]|uniref:Uncharacterized protein n=1 Tax=Selaginella moellendorffii TaxID=88036 RepID=D8QZ06_SELML|nr:hypothetical protein SELMODRAFT_405569 [Selaginella moellendorffii]
MPGAAAAIPGAAAAVPNAAAAMCPGQAFGWELRPGWPWWAGTPANRHPSQVPAQSAQVGHLAQASHGAWGRAGTPANRRSRQVPTQSAQAGPSARGSWTWQAGRPRHFCVGRHLGAGWFANELALAPSPHTKCPGWALCAGTWTWWAGRPRHLGAAKVLGGGKGAWGLAKALGGRPRCLGVGRFAEMEATTKGEGCWIKEKT